MGQPVFFSRINKQCFSLFLFLQTAASLFSFGQTGTRLNLAVTGATEPAQSQPEYFNLSLTFAKLQIQNKHTVKVRAFVNGGEMAILAETSLMPNQDKLLVNYNVKNNLYYGIGEVVIENLGAFPIVINNKKGGLSLSVDIGNLTQYLPPADGPELSILGQFLKIYRGYEAMHRRHNDILVSPWGVFSSDTAAYTSFLKDYVSFRKQFNLFFEYARAEFPGTYVSDHLAGMFIQPDIAGLDQARDLYFKNWNFNDSIILNNPLLNRQLDIYRFISGFPALADMNKTTDGLFSYAKGYHWSSALVTDHITRNWTLTLFQDNKDGKADKAIEHFYQRWLSNEMGNCSEEANGKEAYQKAFYKRLANIGKMGTGMLFPRVSGFTKENKKLVLQDELVKKPYTVLFLWSSTCSHCEEYVPVLLEMTKKYKDKLQVFAYSIDKKETEAGWMQRIKQRTGLDNWKDVAEINDAGSEGVSGICYIGTPSVFLVDKSGKLVSKDSNPEVLNRLINSK